MLTREQLKVHHKNIGGVFQGEEHFVKCYEKESVDILLEAQAQQIRLLEQQEKAWRIAFDGLEKQHKALTDQIPAEMINADPILMERVTTAAAMEEIGRQQIADLQAKVKELETEVAQLKGRIAVDEDSHL